MIWKPYFSLDYVNSLSPKTAAGHLGIEFTELGDNWIEARMPLEERTKQPAGVLHGGISVALAETVASCAALGCVDPEQYHCVGLEINANHVRAAKSGWVYARAEPLHIGRSTHVWEVKIRDDDRKLVCASRCTMSVIEAHSRYISRTPD